MDYKAIINNLLISTVEKQSPQAAETFRIFERHGINALEAMQILLELGAAFGKIGDSAGEGDKEKWRELS